MSHIAAALAKSKGKQIATPLAGNAPAPAVVAPPVAAPRPALQASLAAALPNAATAQSAADPKAFPLWIKLVGGLAVVVLGGLAWLLLRPADSAPVATQPAPAVKPATTAAVTLTPTLTPAPATTNPVVSSMPTPVVANPSTSLAVVAPTTPPAAPSAVGATGSPPFTDVVMKLAITAVRPGNAVMIGGKLYRLGEQVSDQLTVQSVESNRVLFRDASGQVYERRL